MYIMLSLFLQILDNIPVPPKLRDRTIRKNQINERHFCSGDSEQSHHIRQTPQMSDAKNFSCNFAEL